MSTLSRSDFDSFNAAMVSYFLKQPNATMFNFCQFAMDNPDCRTLLGKLANVGKERQRLASMAIVVPTSSMDSDSMDTSV